MAVSLTTELPTELFIGGKWREASDGERFDVIDPATEGVIANIASASEGDALDAVAAANDAFGFWARTPPRERAEILRAAFELMIERRDDIATTIVRENGKPLSEAFSEVTYAAEFFRWFSEEAVRNRGILMRAPSGRNRIMVSHEPVGVSVLITPWNFPAAMATRKIAPALAAGCTVILKPASESPLTSLLIGRLMEEVGLPLGVVNVLPAKRSGVVVSRILEDSRVRKLSFTGSTEVGRILLEQAAKRIVDCSMELGGNAPFIVFDDADLETAVKGALLAKLRNCGEACTAANRFYVQAGIADRFANALTKAFNEVKVGPGLDEEVSLGPLINDHARRDIDELISDAVERGAKVLTGGKARGGRGFFYPATVLDRVQEGSTILKHEIFGPVAPIVRFSDEEDAIHLANNTVHGLVAYIYTSDLARGLRVSERVEFGMVGLNRGIVSDPAAPFGGVKESGIGREGSYEGMLAFTETKYIATDW